MSGQAAVVEKGRSALRRMVYLSQYAFGGWRHTRERRQGSVGFWTGICHNGLNFFRRHVLQET